MKQKSLVILTIAAFATIALAAISISHRDPSASEEATSASSTTSDKNALFPGLLAKVNDVTTIVVKKGDTQYTIAKVGDTFGLAEKGNFRVEMDPVRKMLIVMGEMRKIEAKTSDRARYEAFGVQDPGEPGSTSALVTLKDASGTEIAQLVLGKEHESKGAVATNQRYVRKGNDPQTWLVQGTFDLKEKGSDLLEKKILEIKRDRVRSVEITQPDGDLLAVDRASPTLTDYTLVGIPDGKELTYPTAPGSVATGLEYLNLDDVEPAGKIDYTTAPGPVAKFKTFDGLVVTATTKDQDGKAWAKFAASYEAPPAAPAPAAPKEGDPAAPTPPAPAKSADEVQKEVADLNAELSKWDYQISSYARTNLGKKKSELLKDKAPPPTPVDPNAPKDPNAPDKDTFMIPNNLPPEIQAQIKADQESKGHKVSIQPPKSGDAPNTDEPKTDGQAPTPAPVDPHKPDPSPTEPPH